MKRITFILSILLLMSSLVTADKLPSEVFKKEVLTNTESSKSSFFSEEKKNDEFISNKDDMTLYADEPDPEGGEGGGQGQGGFIGSDELPFDDNTYIPCLLLFSILYLGCKTIRSKRTMNIQQKLKHIRKESATRNIKRKAYQKIKT